MRAAALSLIGLLALPAHAEEQLLFGQATIADRTQAAIPSQNLTGFGTVLDWTGFYVGAQVGNFGLEVDGGAAAEGNGTTFGVHAGYQQDLGDFVIGGEIEFDNGGFEIDGEEVENVTRFKLRGGYDLGSFLVYGTAGISRLQFATEGSDSGPFGGIGASFAVNEQVTVGGEVLYQRIDDFNETGFEVEATTASARVSFNF